MSKPDPDAVRATFTRVARRYDLANHMLSGGIDFSWRRRLVRLANTGSCSSILDLATGSGDVVFALECGLESSPEIIGLDFCEPMLTQARKKRDELKLNADKFPFVVGDCLDLPFSDDKFDLVTISFGLRNLADREKGLSEIYRVLKPGGRLIVLEFSQPYWWFRPFYYFYLRLILPWLARLVTGDREAYLYLGTSISNFPNRFELCKELEAIGFKKVVAQALTFSIVSLHHGCKE
ncbi:MAG: bifunctional demethylmenaquinone methyltransferase/2-methoxy-6-polyprenyl-1,4-benzoquinol methylase UbiE [Opitutae bacterium]|nr:bifunctional demethylmenaquinone methyltransferase/2-methoxy-6-polyprenyl-1,4-benzoquinol methylase UbiE [Opitutae bacterium]